MDSRVTWYLPLVSRDIAALGVMQECRTAAKRRSLAGKNAHEESEGIADVTRARAPSASVRISPGSLRAAHASAYRKNGRSDANNNRFAPMRQDAGVRSPSTMVAMLYA